MNLGLRVYRQDKPHPTIVGEGSGLFYYSNYPSLYLKNESVKVEGLENSMLPIFTALQAICIFRGIKTGLIITSGNDFSGHLKQGNKVSKHYVNRAIDISRRLAITNQPAPMGSIVIDLKKYLSTSSLLQNYDIVEELDHIHIEYDPKDSKEKKKIEETPAGEPGDSNFKQVPIRYIHTEFSITTVQDLLSSKYSLFSYYKDKIEELLNYTGETSLTNKQRVEREYRGSEKYPLLKMGTELLLDPNKINRNFLSTISESQVIDSSTFPIFYTKIREEMESSEKYVPSQRYLKSSDGSYENSVTYINSFVQVWVYCKSRNKIFDITRLCNSVTVNSGKPGSSFSIDCPMFDGDIDGLNLQESNSVIISGLPKIHPLSKLITSNDIVWIKFEELEEEEDHRKVEGNTNWSTIDEFSLAGQFYDMIGLVDSTSPSIILGEVSGSVTISGRCLSKLFLDDEALFFPLSVITDSNSGNLLIGSSHQDKLVKRLFADGLNYSLFAKSFRTIEDTMKFYINQLSNMSLLPKEVEESFFRSYGDRRTQVYSLKGEEKPTVQTKFAAGIYQIIKFQFDDAVKGRTIVDSTVSSPEGSLISLFYKVCQEPLVEFLMDTYKDTFNIVVRKPPFDRESILSSLSFNYNLSSTSKLTPYLIKTESLASENLSFNENFYTWFSIYNRGIFMGVDQSTALTYVPIVYFPEFVDIWGSKSLRVDCNYTRTNDLGSEEDKKQIINDLLYIIESSIYLPFTRTGTITLNRGDRRIKKGTWIEYEKTGEVFYIESVSNIASITDREVIRKTTLQVSHGIKKDFITERDIDGKKISYFNIVDLKSLKKTLLDFLLNKQEASISRSVLVNKEVFDFFLQKRQLDE